METSPPPSESLTLSEERLIREFLLGDSRAVARVEAMIDRVVRFRGYYVPVDERRDLVQEALLTVCQALSKPGFSVRTGFTAFVRSIAHRRCVDWMRRHRTSLPIEIEGPVSVDPPDHQLAEEEEKAMALEVLKELPEGCRRLIRLHALDQMTYRQIAALQGRSEGSLRNQMSECLKEARMHLDRKRAELRTGRDRPRKPLGKGQSS